jgi:hypothetical protein
MEIAESSKYFWDPIVAIAFRMNDLSPFQVTLLISDWHHIVKEILGCWFTVGETIS